jgi:DNA invertase Pin-like site-specific DNA recombinase
MGVEENNIYMEYESGSKADRKELKRLLDAVNEGDTIKALEVSRITRSTKQLCEIIDIAKDKKIQLVLGSLIVDCRGELDPMTEGMLKLMGVVSEIESNMVKQRVKSGLANARAKGIVLGRPKTTVEDIPQNIINSYELVRKKKINKSECARMCSISRVTLNKYIKIMSEC